MFVSSGYYIRLSEYCVE